MAILLAVATVAAIASVEVLPSGFISVEAPLLEVAAIVHVVAAVILSIRRRAKP